MSIQSESNLKPDHNHRHRQMLAQLPYEIVDHIIGYLDFKDVRSIARVCSAFRVPAQLRLFRSIYSISNFSRDFPDHIASILSSPHLLQCVSHLVVIDFPHMRLSSRSLHSLWSHLPIMHRLRHMDIHVQSDDCLTMLSTPESLGLVRKLTLSLSSGLAPDLLISDDPLPVHDLELWVKASNTELATRFIQKCSQSLRKLHLSITDTIPSLPLLPHLYDFSLRSVNHRGNDPDLVPLFPFLHQHPTITRIILGSEFTLTVQPPPTLLPNLRFLSATPAIIEQLVPGRPVNEIHTEYSSHVGDYFPVDIMLQALRQPFVPVTALTITTDSYWRCEGLTDIVQALPKLREVTLRWPYFVVRRLFKGRGGSNIDFKTGYCRLSRPVNCSWEMYGHGSHPTVPLRQWLCSRPSPAFMVERQFRPDGTKGTREWSSWSLEF